MKIEDVMYRRPKFLEILLDIRQSMAREADYDVDLFAELVRGDKFANHDEMFALSEPKPEAVGPAKPAKRVRRAG